MLKRLALIAFALALAPPAQSPEVFVRASQLGYLRKDLKIATVFGSARLPQSFEVVADDSHVVRRADVRRQQGAWGRFETFGEIDFSALETPGRYRLRATGEPVESQPFTIGDDVFTGAADAMLEFMRSQRCGYNPFLDVVCHRLDGRTVEGPRAAGSFLPAHGGWHDAGDTLKYLMTSSNATAQLLLAYRVSPKPWKDRVNDLGQPGANGRPDILDEARWGLEWMLRLHPAAAELYHMVGDDRDHSGWRLPHEDQSDYGWGKGGYRTVYFATGAPQGLGKYRSESTGVANLSGRYAAAMALAYQTWKDSPADAAFARQCLRAAREVYALGRAKPGAQQGNSFGSPYRYNETTWADDMEWGAAELYRATGEPRYLHEAVRDARRIAATSWMGRESAAHYEFYPFMNAGHFRVHGLSGTGAAVRAQVAGYYRDGLDAASRSAQQNPWRIGVPFIWCSNNLVVALATQGEMYERMTGVRDLRPFTTRQRDWLFGVNPWGVSMFTGIGADSPTDVHLPWLQLTGRKVAGGLVDGPVQASIFTSLKGVALSRPDRFEKFQSPEAVYHDDWQDYSSNEPTMDGTASAILLMALQSRTRR
jgi:endoglucanase